MALTSTKDASANVSSRFQASNCASLKFTPKLTALTRANGEFVGHGASLHVVIVSPAAQANMRSLKLDLPQRLPARLETIQKACPENTFKRNPAACSKASVIGNATVATPILAASLRGPAYLVAKGRKTSSGASAFPDMVLVLQGEGVRIDLVGGLYVDEHNIARAHARLPRSAHRISPP